VLLGIAHAKEYSVNEMRRLHASSGLEIERMETFDHNIAVLDHDRAWQVGDHVGRSPAGDDSALDGQLRRFLTSIDADQRLLGDYFFVTSRWKEPVVERYPAPIYAARD
jgi:hypothetical protein